MPIDEKAVEALYDRVGGLEWTPYAAEVGLEAAEPFIRAQEQEGLEAVEYKWKREIGNRKRCEEAFADALRTRRAAALSEFREELADLAKHFVARAYEPGTESAYASAMEYANGRIRDLLDHLAAHEGEGQ